MGSSWGSHMKYYTLQSLARPCHSTPNFGEIADCRASTSFLATRLLPTQRKSSELSTHTIECQHPMAFAHHCGLAKIMVLEGKDVRLALQVAAHFVTMACVVSAR